jgi:RNA polymerase sigma factor (sigma-70 family)
MMTSQQLLREYLAHGSEAAFRELVTRYTGLVYSTALRLVGGDIHQAEDIAQTVFVDLARKARKLSNKAALASWLYRDTCFVAAKAMRGERHRQARERETVQMNAQEDHSQANFEQVAPVLDEAMNQLAPEDQSAIGLRFFEQLDYPLLGEALGSTEEAARKRVNRALDKLHALLTARGVTLTAAALGAALTAGAVQAAPAQVAASVGRSCPAQRGRRARSGFELAETDDDIQDRSQCWQCGRAGGCDLAGLERVE